MTIVQTQWQKKKMISKSKTLICLHWNEKIRFYFLPAENCSHILLLCMRLMTKSDAWTVMNSATRRWGKFAFYSPRFFIRVRRTTIKRKVCHLFLRWWPIPANIFLKKIWLSTLKPILYMNLVMFKKKENHPESHRFEILDDFGRL